MESINTTVIEAQVVEALQTCFDPEIPVDIYELGLIYEIKVDPSGCVTITMTLTSPACPAAQSIPADVEGKLRAIPGVMGTPMGSRKDVRGSQAPAWHAMRLSASVPNDPQREEE